MPRTGATQSVSLDRWKHAAVQEVHLQSGAGIVQQQPGTLALAIRGGRVPNPLLPMAIKAEYEGLDAKKLDPDELALFESFKDWYIAETVKDPVLRVEVDDEGRVIYSDIDELPSGDREQLWLNALHLFDSRLTGALASLAELRSFRDGTRGDAASGDGEGSGGTPE